MLNTLNQVKLFTSLMSIWKNVEKVYHSSENIRGKRDKIALGPLHIMFNGLMHAKVESEWLKMLVYGARKGKLFQEETLNRKRGAISKRFSNLWTTPFISF